MAEEKLDYWYDAQIRRISQQVTRIFSNFSYAIGYSEKGEYILRKVPARYAITNRQVAHILRNNSRNVMLSIPMITVFLRDVEYARDRVQEPFHVDNQRFFEREYDFENRTYTSNKGAAYTLKRIMAIPYRLTFQVDLWTSNNEQKNQIAEQIMVLFNPGIQIQNSDNVFDWTALGELELVNINWSSRGIDIGTTDEIEITTFEFRLETWISPPAILDKQKVIETIITDIKESDDIIQKSFEQGLEIDWSDSDFLARIVVTPGNHSIEIKDNKIILLGEDNSYYDSEGNIFSWKKLFDEYGGSFKSGKSMIVVNITDNIENFQNAVKGTIEYGNNINELVWNIDPLTLPANNFPNINAIIDPLKTYPGYGLPTPSPGTKYLILNDIGDSLAWGNITAKKNSIIEFDGTKWNVIFIPELEKDNVYYLTNLFNGKQLYWNGSEWNIFLEGIYSRGFWRLFL